MRNLGMRDLFWGIVIVSFMIANGLILNQKSAEVAELRQMNQLLAADVKCLYKHTGDDFTDIKGFSAKHEALGANVSKLFKYSCEDLIDIRTLQAQVRALQADNQLLYTKVERLDRYSADDFVAINKLRTKTAKLEDQQNIEYTVLKGDVADLQADLKNYGEWTKNCLLLACNIFDQMQATIAKNAALVSIGLNDVNLTCSQLSDGHIGSLYASDSQGNLSVLGDCNGKGWDKEKASILPTSLELSPDIAQEVAGYTYVNPSPFLKSVIN